MLAQLCARQVRLPANWASMAIQTFNPFFNMLSQISRRLNTVHCWLGYLGHICSLVGVCVCSTGPALAQLCHIISRSGHSQMLSRNSLQSAGVRLGQPFVLGGDGTGSYNQGLSCGNGGKPLVACKQWQQPQWGSRESWESVWMEQKCSDRVDPRERIKRLVFTFQEF